MSEQQSPWSRPGSVDTSPAVVVYPSPSAAPPPSTPGVDLGPGWSRSGAVTQLSAAPGVDDPPPDVVQFGKPQSPAGRQRRLLMWFGGSAAVIVTIGVIVLLALTMTGNGPLQHRPSGPSDYRPPLAKACPPPSAAGQNLPPVPPPPAGPRTVDTQSGISYASEGAPWGPWSETWEAGDLHVRYGVGQHFVTEIYSGGTYHASILSGSVPAAENDALTLDLKCTGHQVMADVRSSYYPEPNTVDMMRDEVTTLGGRPAWVTKFRLHFHTTGLKATSELVGLALVDVGRPNAAVLYVSIPNTVNQFDPLVDRVLDSVRPT